MRFLIPALALATAATIGGAAAHAQAGRTYTAVAVAAPARPSLITRSTLWKCTGTTCTALEAPERPAIVCELVVQRIGRLASFAVGDTPFDPAALDKCNTRAK